MTEKAKFFRKSLLRRLLAGAALGIAVTFLPIASSEAQAKGVCYRGVNLSGAEYGEADGVEGINFTYPSEETVRYFADKGMNMVRLPFHWDRIQPVRAAALDPVEVERLKNSVELIKSNGMKVILDPHNFGYYRGQRLMTPGLGATEFADLWVRLAIEFANDEEVLFGLMNEPYDIPAEDWLVAANQAIGGIRATGARNMILVPGTHYSGANSWHSDLPLGNNSKVMVNVVDPMDNFIYEIHQYFDDDLSGTHKTCPNLHIAVDGLNRVKEWLEQQNARALLGEFGGSSDPQCMSGLREIVDLLNENPERWYGWTYWAGGEWWSEDEGNNIQPTDKGDRPQLSAIMDDKFVSSNLSCSTIN